MANSATSIRTKPIIGFDLGGTKMIAGVVSPADKILARSKRPTPFDKGQKAVSDDIIACINECLAQTEVAVKDLGGIGMGSPGPLNPDTGVVLRTGNIALRNWPIGKILSDHFGVPAFIDNDVKMGCFGEFKCGAGKGHKNIVGLWMGTGVGGCIIRDGELVHGANRNAAELGHVILDAKLHSSDSDRGTLETEASKNGMAAYIRRRIEKGEKTTLKKAVQPGGRLKSSDLAEAYEEGDEAAVGAVEHSAHYCGLAVANLFNILSPELYILGGGVVEAIGPKYLKLVEKAANRFVYTTELAPIKIAQAKLGDDGGILGSAIAAREKLSKK